MSDAHNQPISDDQELAQVLQGMQQQNRTMAGQEPEVKPDGPATPELQYEEAAAPGDNKSVDGLPPVEPLAPADAPAASHTASSAGTVNPMLESLKKEALEELRPLAARLDLPAKEKFDTMLLIIRSTDDQDLLQPAHEAAKSIDDDMQRAEALLDIVKEIDYFAGQGQK